MPAHNGYKTRHHERLGRSFMKRFREPDFSDAALKTDADRLPNGLLLGKEAKNPRANPQRRVMAGEIETPAPDFCSFCQFV